MPNAGVLRLQHEVRVLQLDDGYTIYITGGI